MVNKSKRTSTTFAQTPEMSDL